MTILPIVERELRAEARHAFTYWLRVTGASALFIIAVLVLSDQSRDPSEVGAHLFGYLNTALFIAIWALVPLLTADCISRERREGTLGLLFLTPLTPVSVVIGKSLVHALRALTLLLAVFPVLTLPILLGGVTWREYAMALLINLSSVCLALGAGLVASSRCVRWNRALLLAEMLAAVFLMTFGALVVFAFISHVVVSFDADISWRDISPGDYFEGAAVLCTGLDRSLFDFLPAGAIGAWLRILVAVFLIAVLVLALCVSGVARRLKRSRREEPASARQLWWEQFLFAPLLMRAFFHRKMARSLERNPVGWLQQRRTTARVTKWGWCLFVAAAETTLLIASSIEGLANAQLWLVMLLSLGLAASAAASFREDRETGALELILVSPLSAIAVMFGRLKALWLQFLPSALLLGITLIALVDMDVQPYHWGPHWESDRSPSLVLGTFVAMTIFALPITGLYFSLTRRHFLASWLATISVGLVLPLALGGTVSLVSEINLWTLIDLGPLLQFSVWHFFDWQRIVTHGLVVQFVGALLMSWLLLRNLRDRKFALSRI